MIHGALHLTSRHGSFFVSCCAFLWQSVQSIRSVSNLFAARLVVLGVVGGFSLLVSGCTEPTTGVVTGTVTVDGTPAKEGSIAFFPLDRKSSTAGAAIMDGKYTATVPLGQAKVEIRVPKVVGQKKLYDTPDSPIKPLLAESLPAKYNDASELTLDVVPGENQKDYELATK
jgi:hypothetical protein